MVTLQKKNETEGGQIDIAEKSETQPKRIYIDFNKTHQEKMVLASWINANGKENQTYLSAWRDERTIEKIRRHGSNILCSRWLCFNDFFISANAQKRSYKADLTVRKRK